MVHFQSRPALQEAATTLGKHLEARCCSNSEQAPLHMCASGYADVADAMTTAVHVRQAHEELSTSAPWKRTLRTALALGNFPQSRHQAGQGSGCPAEKPPEDAGESKGNEQDFCRCSVQSSADTCT